MSSFQFHSAFDQQAFVNGHSVPPAAGEFSAVNRPSDRAIDATLRGVPLPEGLMTRLGKLVYTLPDEAAGHADWLGC